MLSLALASENLVFSIALVLMLMIAVLEGVAALFGAGMSSALESLLPESELSPHTEVGAIEADSALSRFLGWLRIGEVPILMLLVIFLLSFGLAGLLLQGLLHSVTGSLAPGWLAVPVVFLLSLPVVRLGGGVLQAIMPKDETTAVTEDSLLGRIAVITLGTARLNYPAEARVKDQHGYSHYLQLEPDTEGDEFVQGTEVLLLSRQGAVYKGIRNANPHLSDQDPNRS
ncbi:YqiJ family protein [Arsukibacterium indicum]|uniref:YqiJ family protein n=1 Tax=Arsukibacterium indicum TaxID=2848612 RepID=A0ABS6MPZ8_9GAMM|nr:YqiJ family protein [Arsukibacterium indicum]MBV2130866.1 YqiJ family protein [Arsukibacterium indicum]